MGHYRPQAMDDLVNIIGASSQAPAGLCTDSDEFASKETLGRDRSLIHARNRPQLTRGVASRELQRIPPSQAEST